ncbi:MAG TPA: response regulator [Anaerolineaceae bacterium]|nr:response regulator [Anaerolineaceae bacterium]
MANEKILVIDDSPEIVRFLKHYILGPLGYEVITANDGQTGLEMAISSNPDLILLDMSMPRMTGLQVLASLRESSSKAPVIFMTMHGSEQIAVEVFRQGVRDYLVKPFTVEEVTQAVDRSLQEGRLAREKESLMRELVAQETIRQTVITLAHYLNNSLTVVQAGLSLIQESIQKKNFDTSLLYQVVEDSLANVRQIGAVMRVLQRITRVQDISYHGQVKMLDIEQALKDELDKG